MHKILSMDTKRAALKEDRFEFIDDHRRRGLLTSMMGKKKRERRNDREMIPSSDEGSERTMEGRKRISSALLL